MGMFDELKIDKIHLPKSLKNKETGWQTKSLDNCLFLIIISKEGKLYETESHLITDKPSTPIELDYTGEIRFYRYENNVFITFVAFFDKGQMFKIIQIN